jgi:hypothetical protein
MQSSGTKVKHTERLESLHAARHHAAEFGVFSISAKFGGQGLDAWSRSLPRIQVSCESVVSASCSDSHTVPSPCRELNPSCVDSLSLSPSQVRGIGQSEVKIDGLSKLARTLLTRFHDRDM